MDARDLLLMQHAAVHSVTVRGRGRPTLADHTFGRCSDDEMRRRPMPSVNSLAWLLWHIARAEDLFVNVVLSDRPQVFVDGWAARMRIARPDLGTGMTAPEVSALSEEVDVAALRAYRDAVGRRTRAVVEAMPKEAWDGRVEAEALERAAEARGFGPNAASLPSFFTGWPRAALLASITVLHSAEHIGEAATVRGLGGIGSAS